MKIESGVYVYEFQGIEFLVQKYENVWETCKGGELIGQRSTKRECVKYAKSWADQYASDIY